MEGLFISPVNVKNSSSYTGINDQIIIDTNHMEVMYCSFNGIAHFHFSECFKKEETKVYHVLKGRLYVKTSLETFVIDEGGSVSLSDIEEDILVYGKLNTDVLFISNRSNTQITKKSSVDLNDLIGQIDKKDNYTLHHCKRVLQYAFDLGLYLDLSNLTLFRLRLAAMFHDLGKIDVPDSILNKSGPFSEEEFLCMKKHPASGGAIIEKSELSRKEEIKNIIMQHHERVDGTGYPYGLTGEDICLEAKIIAIADTYDAMTTDRPYKKALTREEAIEELKRLAGTQLEARLVRDFIEMLRPVNF